MPFNEAKLENIRIIYQEAAFEHDFFNGQRNAGSRFKRSNPALPIRTHEEMIAHTTSLAEDMSEHSNHPSARHPLDGHVELILSEDN